MVFPRWMYSLEGNKIVNDVWEANKLIKQGYSYTPVQVPDPSNFEKVRKEIIEIEARKDYLISTLTEQEKLKLYCGLGGEDIEEEEEKKSETPKTETEKILDVYCDIEKTEPPTMPTKEKRKYTKRSK